MGSFRYCDKCESSMPGPWNMDTVDILFTIMSNNFHVQCLHCGTMNHYFPDALIEELAERIDKNVKKEGE